MYDKANMQFHNYLEVLIGSKTAIRVVQALIRYPGKVFTVRKLAATANVSISETAATVQQLEKYGILKIQPVGRSYLLTLNENGHILNKVLRPLIRAEQSTLDALVSTLKANLDSAIIRSAVIFGSVAAGKEREDSDIDLLIISNNFEAASAIVSKTQDQVSLGFNSRLSPMIMDEKELLKKKDDRLVRSIVSNHVAIAGIDLKELLARND